MPDRLGTALTRGPALPSLQHRLYPRSKAQLTPADLQKAARVHEDRDPSFDMQGEYLSDGTEVRPFVRPSFDMLGNSCRMAPRRAPLCTPSFTSRANSCQTAPRRAPL